MFTLYNNKFQSSSYPRAEEGTQSSIIHDVVDPSSNSVSRNPKFLFGLGGLRDELVLSHLNSYTPQTVYRVTGYKVKSLIK